MNWEGMDWILLQDTHHNSESVFKMQFGKYFHTFLNNKTCESRVKIRND